MANADDVYLVLTKGDRPVRRISPDGLEELSGEIRRNFVHAMQGIRKKLETNLRIEWLKYIRERPRNENYARGRSDSLLHRMAQAFANSKVVDDGDSIAAQVFDLQYIDIATRGEGQRTELMGWFNRFADGHSGRAHGSSRFGFITLEFAIHIADRISRNDSDDKRLEFLARIEQDFAGRHGEGIMVRLDQPLFYDRPDAGTAEDWGIEPHRGYRSWPALRTFNDLRDARNSVKTGGNHWILKMVDKVLNKAMKGE